MTKDKCLFDLLINPITIIKIVFLVLLTNFIMINTNISQYIPKPYPTIHNQDQSITSTTKTNHTIKPPPTTSSLTTTHHHKPPTNHNLTPPIHHPWHRWPSPTINHTALIHKLETLGRGIDDNTTHNTLYPYLIRHGRIYRPQTLLDDLLSHNTSAHKVTSRIHPFEDMLSRALARARSLGNNLARLWEGDYPLLFVQGDYRGCNDDLVPLWTYAAMADGCNASWPLAAYNLWSHDATNTTREWDDRFRAWDDAYPWREKDRRAVWRGGTTGPGGKTPAGVREYWRELPRAQLVDRGMRNGELMDFGFSKISGEWRHKEEEIVRESRVVDRVAERDFMKYRAVVDIDGNSWSSRYGTLLCYNSVVIKVEPEFVNYFDKELIPWKHFIPVHANLSNLEQMVAFAVSKENEDQVRRIIKQSQSWCREKLIRSQIVTDFLWTLVSYVEMLDRGGDQVYEMWKNNHDAYHLPLMNMTLLSTITNT